MTAPIYDTATKDARMNAVRDMVRDGGQLQLQAANDDVLASWTLTETGGSVTSAVWTLAVNDSEATGTAAASTGTAATKARIIDSGSVARITGLSVGTESAAVIVDNTSIAEDQVINLSSATITHAPDPD